MYTHNTAYHRTRTAVNIETPKLFSKSDTVIIPSETTYRVRDVFIFKLKYERIINMDELFECFIIISMSKCVFFSLRLLFFLHSYNFTSHTQKIWKIEIYSFTYFLLAAHFCCPFSHPLWLEFFFQQDRKEVEMKKNVFTYSRRGRAGARKKKRNVNVRTRNLNVISCTRGKWIKNDEVKL